MKAMEMTWNNMEKKEKLMWIKKAAEDQKRYEVGRRALLVSMVAPRELRVRAPFWASSCPQWVGCGAGSPSLGCVTLSKSASFLL